MGPPGRALGKLLALGCSKCRQVVANLEPTCQMRQVEDLDLGFLMGFELKVFLGTLD